MNRPSNTSSELLWHRLDAIGRRAWRFALLIGICKLLLLVGSFLLIAGLLDYLLQWSDVGTRWVMTLMCVLAIAFGIMRWVFPVFRIRLSTSQVAGYVERALQLPDGWLSSVAEFRDPSRSTASGDSSELRRQAIVQAESLFSVAPLESAVDLRIVVRWFTLSSIAGIGLMALCLAYPRNCWTALERLMLPWSGKVWPRSCELEFRGLPAILAQGVDLEIVAINRIGPVPADVRLVLRDAEGSNLQEFDMQIFDNQALFRIPQVDKNIELRAVSIRDNRMPWHRVQVTKPPELESFAFDITPPTYAGLEPSQISGQSIRVLAGSEVRLQGQFDQTVDRVDIDGLLLVPAVNASKSISAEAPPDYAGSRSQAPPENANEKMRPKAPDANWSLKLLPDHQHFVLESRDSRPIRVEQSLRFHLRWQSTDGLIARTTSPFDIEVTPDLPPDASWTENARRLSISPIAQVPIRGVARDDLKIEDFTLNWEVTGQDGEVKSHDHSRIVDLPQSNTTQSNTTQSQSAMNSREIEADRQWIVPSCSPGDSISIWLAAVDSAGQTGQSSKQTLDVNDPSELMQELANTQFDVSQTIRQSVARQRQSKSALAQFVDVLLSNNALESEDRQSLANAVLQQEAANRWLADDRDGAIERLQKLDERLKQNGLQNSDFATQVQSTLQKLNQVYRNRARPSLENLQSAQSVLQNSKTPADLTADLNNVIENQSAIEADLNTVLAELGQQATMRDYWQQLQAIAREQEVLLSDTNQLTNLIISSRDAAQLENKRIRIQSSQREVARRLDQVIADSGQATTAPATSDSPDLTQLMELRSRLVESGISQMMRQAAELLASSANSGRSEEIQKEILQKLREIIGVGEQSTESNTFQMADQLKAIEQRLRVIADQQADLAKSIAQGQIDATAAARDQRAISQRTAKQLQELDNARLPSASNALREATLNQEQASSELTKNNMSAATEAAQSAAEQIGRSADEIADAVNAAGHEEQANELMVLQAAVDRILPQQSQTVDRLTALRSLTNKKESDQVKRNVAALQDNLRSSLENAKPKLPSTAAFAFATQLAVDSMRRAAIAIDRDPDIHSSVRHAQSAADRLQAIQLALRDEPTSSPDKQNENEEASQDDDKETPPVMKAILLLRAIQSDIRDRIVEIQTEMVDDKLNPQQWLEVNELAHQQDLLAEQVQQLVDQSK